MHDGQGESTHGELSEWGAYLRRMTSRPDWSVARLARDSGIHRATIFDWIRGGGESVTVASVRAVAAALGDDLENALRAVASLDSAPASADEELDLIMSAPVSDRIRKRMIAQLLQMREQDRQQRLQVFRWMVANDTRAPGDAPTSAEADTVDSDDDDDDAESSQDAAARQR